MMADSTKAPVRVRCDYVSAILPQFVVRYLGSVGFLVKNKVSKSYFFPNPSSKVKLSISLNDAQIKPL